MIVLPFSLSLKLGYKKVLLYKMQYTQETVKTSCMMKLFHIQKWLAGINPKMFMM